MKRDTAPTTALRLPPHSIECEQGIIGALLLDNAVFDRIGDLVSEVDFFRDDHRRIFRHITALIESRQTADVLTVFESLASANESDQTGGLAYLGEIANNTPSTASAVSYANMVRDKSVLRRMIQASDETASEAFAARVDGVDMLVDRAEARLLEIAESRARGRGGFIPVGECVPDVLERLQKLCDSKTGNGVTGLSTGLVDLDQRTTGFHPGDLIVVAGRPSMGKTALALNMAEHAALNEGERVAVFSMEMPTDQLLLRLIASIGRIDQQALRTAQLNEDEWSQVTISTGLIARSPVFIDDTPALTPTEMRVRAKRLERNQGKLGLIVVDYLQLMRSSHEGRENRATEISEISRSLKALAKEMSCPVIALSQLNRALEQRPNKRPVMSDLRESGAIEQDADTIIFIYRDEVYNPDSNDKGTAELILGKQRNGPVGMVRVHFSNMLTKFENLAPGWASRPSSAPPKKEVDRGGML